MTAPGTGTQAPAVLPRSLAPLPNESLASYLVRLGNRLGRTPMEVAELTGLVVPDPWVDLRSGLAFAVEADRLAAFAAACRLTFEEARALTLSDQLGVSLPPAGQDAPPGPGTLRAAWATVVTTKACNQCVSHAARWPPYWQRTWRLAWHYACPKHARLLIDTCPGCLRPYGRVRLSGTEGQLVPGGAVGGLTIDQCRANAGDDGARHSASKRMPRCGQRVADPTGLHATVHLEPDGPALLTQRRLLAALAAGSEATHTAGGVPLPARDWFLALQGIAALVRLARPDTPVAPLDPPLHAALARLEEDRARAGADRKATRALLGRANAPTTPALIAALAVQSLALLDSPDWDTLSERTAELAGRAREREPAQYDRHPEPKLPPIVQRLVRPHTKSSPLQGVVARRTTPSLPTTWTIDARHVRHRLDDTAYDRHLRPFLGLMGGVHRDPESALRRAAAAAVVRLLHDCSQFAASEMLGAADGLTRHSLAGLSKSLKAAGRTAEFRLALVAVARDIEAGPRVDHAARRAALDGWTVPDVDWQNLVQRLARLRQTNARTDWDRRQLYVTAIVWELVTGGEMSYAPVRRRVPAGEQRLFGNDLSRYRGQVLADNPPGVLALLRNYVAHVEQGLDSRAADSRPGDPGTHGGEQPTG